MKTIAAFVLCFLYAALINAQTLEFLKNAHPGHSLIQKVRVSDDDRIFVTGYIYNNTEYEGIPYTSSGIDDVFLAEFDEHGSILWLKTAGSDLYDDRPLDMVIDSENEWIYITGIAGEGAAFGQSVIPHPEYSSFLAKYDFEGNLQWLITPGEEGGYNGTSLALDENGNIYICGDLEGTALFGNQTFPDPGWPASYRSFLAAYSPDGSFLWAREILGHPRQCDIHINNKGKLLIAGSFQDSMKIDGQALITPGSNQEDVFIALSDLNGEVTFLLHGVGEPRHYVGDIVSKSNGAFILAGWSNSTGPVGFSSYNLPDAANFVITLDADDASVLSLENLGEGYFLTRELLLGPSDELVVTGMYTYQAALNGASLPLDHSNEMFLLALDENYNPDWYFTGNGGLNDYGTSMCLLSNGNLILGGYSGDTMRIGDSEIVTGTFDINFFLAKFSNLGFTTHLTKVGKEDLSFYPNPLSQVANLRLPNPPGQRTRFQLFNSLGQTLRTEHVNSSLFELEKNDLSAGTYFWLIREQHAVLYSGQLIIVD